ncbi:DUF58 domain-containing protein [Virgibacillus alimentarius]|uniref:DUF58 domain-containing protein n=1 Tax=Virgibacillus alimentarius TaxID=698769 RepID=UPI0004933BD9|nr:MULTISPECIES: DUF58 domain-containing protein [Virgibacillus]HLR69301.1 DUF58 domain-containing protein [Virgibacillus sp.]
MKALFRFMGNLLSIILPLSILFVGAMFQSDFVSGFLLFSFLPIALYQLGMLFYRVGGWNVRRILSRNRIRAGESISIKLNIQRRIGFPLSYCKIEEVFPFSLQKIDTREAKYHYLNNPNRLHVERTSKRIVFPGFKREFEIPYDIQKLPRGIHQLQAIRIRTGDMFGFIKKEHVFQVTDSLIVYPNERPICLQEPNNTIAQGSLSSHALHFKNINIASGSREYIPGDKFSWIDWKQTASKNKIMTKEFEQEKSVDTVVILDSCYDHAMNHLAFEAAVEVTTSLIETLHRQSVTAGLLTVDKEIHYFPKQHHDVRNHLAQIHPNGKRPFANLLKEASMTMKSPPSLWIVTNNLNEALGQTLKELKQRSTSIALFLVQPSAMIYQRDYQRIDRLHGYGIEVRLISEKQLVKNPIEVNGI